MTGVIPCATRSIAALEAKRFEFYGAGTADEQIVIAPPMPEYPHSEDELRKIVQGVAQQSPGLWRCGFQRQDRGLDPG